MQKILSIYICFILSLGLYATNRIVDQVLWVVGDEPILQSDIENEIARRRYEKESIDGDAYCVIPEQIAIQKLFIAQAKLDSIVVPEGSVDQQVDARIKYFIGQIGSKEKLEEYFKKPLKDIRETMSSSVRDQLMAQGPDGGLIGLNAGEIVLNKAAQGNLASQLNDNSNATPRLMAEVSAEQIRFVIRNNRRRENISETALFR